MSNKQETPVSWLVEQFMAEQGTLYSLDINQALEMERQKQQKYNEILAMLE